MRSNRDNFTYFPWETFCGHMLEAPHWQVPTTYDSMSKCENYPHFANFFFLHFLVCQELLAVPWNHVISLRYVKRGNKHHLKKFHWLLKVCHLIRVLNIFWVLIIQMHMSSSLVDRDPSSLSEASSGLIKCMEESWRPWQDGIFVRSHLNLCSLRKHHFAWCSSYACVHILPFIIPCFGGLDIIGLFMAILNVDVVCPWTVYVSLYCEWFQIGIVYKIQSN